MEEWAVVVESTDDGKYHIGITNGEFDKFIFCAATEYSAKDCANELKKWLEYLIKRRPWGAMAIEFNVN